MSLRDIFQWATRMDGIGIAVTRVALIVVLLWIGGLKVFRYEADGIVPFVVNIPMMSFFYAAPTCYMEYKHTEWHQFSYNRVWYQTNGLYPFALELGSVITEYGLLPFLHHRLLQ